MNQVSGVITWCCIMSAQFCQNYDKSMQRCNVLGFLPPSKSCLTIPPFLLPSLSSSDTMPLDQGQWTTRTATCSIHSIPLALRTVKGLAPPHRTVPLEHWSRWKDQSIKGQTGIKSFKIPPHGAIRARPIHLFPLSSLAHCHWSNTHSYHAFWKGHPTPFPNLQRWWLGRRSRPEYQLFCLYKADQNQLWVWTKVISVSLWWQKC
jgi:hypothetical protein